MNTTIKIMVSQGIPTERVAPKESLKEKVDRYILAIEGDKDSENEYEYLKALYKKLCECKKLKPEMKDLFNTLKDVMMKHGKYDNDSSILNAEDLNKGSPLDNGYSSEDYE